MIMKKEFKPGKIYYYSDFYDKSFCEIKATEITKTKGKSFWFKATIVDNNYLDGKENSWNCIGSEHSYSNSFIYNTLQELKDASREYRMIQANWMIKNVNKIL